MAKKKITILRSNILHIWAYDNVLFYFKQTSFILFQGLNFNAYNLLYLFCDFDHLVIKVLQIFYYKSDVYIFALSYNLAISAFEKCIFLYGIYTVNSRGASVKKCQK